jgi:hypothetical protein
MLPMIENQEALAQQQQEWERRTVIHEAAHCTAAIFYNIGIVSVTLEGDCPKMTSGRYVKHAENFAVLTLCGPAAEQLYFGSCDDKIVRTHYERAQTYLVAMDVDPLQSSGCATRCCG